MKEDKKMDLIFNISSLNSEKEKFTTSKKDILKYLKIIGVDTRFISYTPDKIYINNLRFSKFSRKRESIFKKQYSEMDVIRNSLFQKICLKSSKILSEQIKPNSTILIPKSNHLINLLLEPYTRKYGVRLVYEGEYDLIVNPVNLDDKVNDIFENIFNGEGIDFTKNNDEIYPLMNVPLEWINSFLKMDGEEIIKKENTNEIANSFSEFLDDVAPQYRENVIKASEYIEKKLEIEK